MIAENVATISLGGLGSSALLLYKGYGLQKAIEGNLMQHLENGADIRIEIPNTVAVIGSSFWGGFLRDAKEQYSNEHLLAKIRLSYDGKENLYKGFREAVEGILPSKVAIAHNVSAFTTKLNKDQKFAFLKMARFVLGVKWEAEQWEANLYDKVDSYNWLLLNGWAGTGKTWTINRLIEYVLEVKNMRVGMTAPTNKAVKVLRNNSEVAGKVRFATIHSLLKIKEKKDTYSGKITYEKDFSPYPPGISELDLLIIDETSQLPERLFSDIIPYVRKGLKVIFVGDRKQIPPVNEVEALPFRPEQQKLHKIYPITLETIMRQEEGNPILEYSAELRMGRETVGTNLLKNGDGIQMMGRTWTEQEAVFKKYFDCKEFRADSDYFKVIAWRNTTVDYINSGVRKLIYKEDNLPKIMLGECLLANAPVVGLDGFVVITTNDEFRVERIDTGFSTIEIPSVERKFTWKYYDLDVRMSDASGALRNIHVIHEESEKEYELVKKALTERAMKQRDPILRKVIWKDYFMLREAFDVVAYNYAVTSHKSQGSTYQQVSVQEWDINLNHNKEERQRIKYVAATRAKHTLFLVR